jgi:hypothetical protein
MQMQRGHWGEIELVLETWSSLRLVSTKKTLKEDKLTRVGRIAYWQLERLHGQ